MKVISLYQPYATLMMLGLKSNETRSWDTNYRGTLAIHATKKTPIWCQALIDEDPVFNKYVGKLKLPTGCILGTVELVKTMRTEAWLAHAKILTNSAYEQALTEYQFGDYSPGRFAWVTEKPQQLDVPIPARGSQGFWNYDTNLINQKHGQLHLFG